MLEFLVELNNSNTYKISVIISYMAIGLVFLFDPESINKYIIMFVGVQFILMFITDILELYLSKREK